LGHELDSKTTGRGCIELKGVLTILGDLGIVPTTEKGEALLKEKIIMSVPHHTKKSAPAVSLNSGTEPTAASGFFFDFDQFLRAVKYVRKLSMKRREPGLVHFFERHATRRDGESIVDLRGACHVLDDAGLTPRTREQQQVIAELFMDLDESGSSALGFQQVVKLVCHIIERKERKTRAQLKAYSKSMGIDGNQFHQHVTTFQDLASVEHNALGQRTTKQLLENYGRKLEGEAFAKIYAQLDTNNSNILELSEFLRLIGHLERDRRETQEIAALAEKVKKTGGKVQKQVAPFHILPPSFEDFLGGIPNLATSH